MTEFFDDLEIQDPQRREERLMAALARQVAHAKADAPHYRALLAEVEAAAVTSRAALATLPVTRKSELIELQPQSPPFGGMVALPPGKLARIFQSPGPIYDPEGRGSDWWRFARALHAAGFRAGEIVHNSFSYHMTPAGSMFETAAHALGCAVFPGGVGNTELQARAVADVKPAGYTGTPSFLKTLIEKGREIGVDVSSLRKACVTGEALPPSLRAALKDLGIAVLQCYGTADLGLVAYESPAQEGMIVDENVVVEIVRPGTGDPVPDGEVGEVLVTSLTPEYPLIRFATGDLSAIMAGTSPCGRTNARIKGWMGRADQTTKVKGMFVHPQQVAEVVRRHPQVGRARLVVDRQGETDRMTLHCEVDGRPEGLEKALADTVQAVLKLKGGVAFAVPGSLPNDGKVIEDARTQA
jgi:phenylacetate-CoA ligase